MMSTFLRLAVFSLTAAVCISIWIAVPNIIGLVIGFFGLLVAVGLAELLPEKAGRVTPIAKAVLITGCDSGFGQVLAQHLDSLGMFVFAGCLDAEGEGAQQLKQACSEDTHILQMDVTSDAQVKAALETVKRLMPATGLWGIVNNAGVNNPGDIELMSMDKIMNIVNINLFGTVRTTKAFLPLLRKTKGRVVNVTSVRGRYASPTSGAYTMAKFAGEAFSDTLRLEMAKFGVKVVIIEPGKYAGATDILNVTRLKNHYNEMWDNLDDELRHTYGEGYKDSQLAALEASLQGSSQDPRPVIEAILDALLLVSPSARYLVPGGSGRIDSHKWLVLLNPYVPTSVMDWLILRLSSKHVLGPRALQPSETS